MSIPLVLFLIGLVLVVFFYKDFKAFIYFVVAFDVFLRIVHYLKLNIIKDSAFQFLNAIPENVPEIIRAFDLGMLTEILIFVYVVVYMVFEGFLIRNFIKRKF